MIRKILIILLFALPLQSRAQTGFSLRITDNRGNQLSTYIYQILDDSLLIKGKSEREHMVDYYSRKLNRKEIKQIKACIAEINYAELKGKYAGGYANLGYITATNFPRIMELDLNDKHVSINNMFVPELASIIDCINPLLPAEVRITYNAEQFLPKEKNIEN